MKMDKTIDGKYGTKYWDLFESRIDETVKAVQTNTIPPLRRLSLHITNKCNFNCIYCNEIHSKVELSFDCFKKIINEFSQLGGGILHITGGEPSVVTYIDEAIVYASSKKNVTVNLNTNCYRRLKDETYKHISRLKVSLDTWNAEKFNKFAGRANVFQKVTENIKYVNALPNAPVISITYTVNAQNLNDIPTYLEYYYKNLRVYAMFFSIYKGDNPDLYFKQNDISRLFNVIYPSARQIMIKNNDYDSLWLLNNSHGKRTYEQTNRFPVNLKTPCYLTLSELSIYENGEVSHCSHLHRDGVIDDRFNINTHSLKDILKEKRCVINKVPINSKCLYGCNLKLCKFNTDVSEKLLKK